MALFNYECDEVKRKIQEVSPNYPQLTTYEKEWLFFHKYGYIAGIPVELEYKTVNVSPYGSVSNAIPFQYKSAILKGNTLANIETKYNSSPTTGSWFIAAYDLNSLKINTKYLIRVFNKTNINVTLYPSPKIATGADFEVKANSIGIGTITTKSEINNDVMLRLRSSSESVIGFDCDILLLEYQNGMENWDIPYFEGMQSVKMPVLTTSNEDGTKTNILTVNEDVTLRSNGDICDELNLLTGQLTQRIGEDGVVLSQEVVKTVDLTKLTKPYEGTNHYQLTSNIPCEAIIEVPIVSTGEQTLEEINNY